jgi:hypothetical protein
VVYSPQGAARGRSGSLRSSPDLRYSSVGLPCLRSQPLTSGNRFSRHSPAVPRSPAGSFSRARTRLGGSCRRSSWATRRTRSAAPLVGVQVLPGMARDRQRRLRGRPVAGRQRDVGLRYREPHRVRSGDDGGLGHGRVLDEDRLQLEGADLVPDSRPLRGRGVLLHVAPKIAGRAVLDAHSPSSDGEQHPPRSRRGVGEHAQPADVPASACGRQGLRSRCGAPGGSEPAPPRAVRHRDLAAWLSSPAGSGNTPDTTRRVRSVRTPRGSLSLSPCCRRAASLPTWDGARPHPSSTPATSISPPRRSGSLASWRRRPSTRRWRPCSHTDAAPPHARCPPRRQSRA